MEMYKLYQMKLPLVSISTENWRIPNPHSSAVSATMVDDRDDDYHRIVNTAERHTRCSPAYSLKQK